MNSRFSETYISQNFDFPDSLIYYISHESCDALKKLLVACKFFYLKYKIIPCFLNSNATRKTEIAHKWAHYGKENYTYIPRLWLLYGDAFLYNFQVLQLLPKIYRCEIEVLRLKVFEIYNFNDLRPLLSSKKLDKFFCMTTIIDSDGSIVSMNTIFESVPFVTEFVYYQKNDAIPDKGFTSESAQKLAEIKRFKKIKKFGLNHVPKNFDFRAFGRFIKQNCTFDCDIAVTYDKAIEIETRRKLIAEFRIFKNANDFKFGVQ